MTLGAAGEAVAIAVHLQNVHMMSQPAEQGTGKALGSEQCSRMPMIRGIIGPANGPLIERQIAGYERAGALVTVAEVSNSAGDA